MTWGAGVPAVLWARLLLAVVLLGGCSGGRDDDDTLPPPASSTTTVDYSVPAVIDAAYVEKVMEALDHVYGDAIRILARERQITKEFLEHLASIYGDRFFRLAQDAWVKDAAEGLVGLPARPGDPETTIQQLVRADSNCIVASVVRDFAPTRSTPQEKTPQRFIGLVPLPGDRDGAQINPTPWLMAYDGFTPDGSAPPDPCRAS
jgi:hypothetical protein